MSVVPIKNNNSEQQFRELPNNTEAERALLGILLIKNDAYNAVGDFLQAEHFFEPVHGRIFDAIRKYVEKGQIANPVTLKFFFDGDEALTNLGGSKYLIELANAAGMTINAEDYGKAVYDLALKRDLVAIGETITKDAFEADLDDPATQQIERSEHALFNLATSGSVERNTKHLAVSLAESIARTESAYRNSGKVTGCTTGFVEMDRLLGGFQNSDLVIVAGRPSMGKTALATNMAMSAAASFLESYRESPSGNKPKSVGFFSLEMSSEQLAGRLLAGATGLNSSKLRRGDLSSDDFSKLVEGSNTLSEMPLYIDDTPALSISAMRTRARRLKRMHNLSLLVVDYLQLLRGSQHTAQQGRVQEISEITQGLKAIAKELDIPVIALSQLSRQVEQREDKRPQLSDLRESGSIEQDSDVVMFVFREEYYLARSMPREGTPKHAEWQQDMDKVHGVAEIMVAKQRHGPIGTVKLAFHSDTTKFGNLAQDNYTPAYE